MVSCPEATAALAITKATVARSQSSRERVSEMQDGYVAIDEGYFAGTHTQPMALPTGEPIAPTGKRVRLRECDVLVVEGGLEVAHRVYFDQLSIMRQLGLAHESTSLAGRLTMLVSHPVTVGRAFARRAYSSRHG